MDHIFYMPRYFGGDRVGFFLLFHHPVPGISIACGKYRIMHPVVKSEDLYGAYSVPFLRRD